MVKFAFPIFLSLVLQMFYQTVDMVIVGRYVGNAGVSAISNVASVSWIIIAVATGFSAGGGVLISQYKGAKNFLGQKNASSNLFFLMCFFSAIIIFIMMFFSRQIVGLLNLPSEAVKYAEDVMFFLSFGMFFTFGYSAISASIQALGDSKTPLFAVIISTISNVFLDILFVKNFSMGPVGATIATVISQIISFFYVVIIFKIKFFKNEKFFIFKFNRDVLKKLIKLSIPIAAQISIVEISYTFVLVLTNAYGVIVSSASGIIMKILALMSVPTWSVGQAVAVMVGQNMGANKINRVKKAGIVGLKINLISSLIVVVIFQIFAKQIISIFTHDEKVLKVGIELLRIAGSFGLFGYSTMFTFDLFAGGVGHTKFAFINAFVDAVIMRIFLCLLFGTALGFGYAGVYFGETCSSFLPAFIGICYFKREKWKSAKLIN